MVRVECDRARCWFGNPLAILYYESELSLSHDYRCGEAEPSQTRHEETGARRGGEGWAHRERERRLAGEQ